MNLLKRILQKPEYIYRPKQIVNRLLYNRTAKRQINQTIVLPWNIPIEINIGEVIGKSLFLFGLYDLSLTEAVNRIVKNGDTVFDIGANIGYVTSLMSFLAGNKGKVYAFEPNPLILTRLKRNLEYARKGLPYSNVVLQEKALSQFVGESDLYIPSFFDDNEGTASLEVMGNSKKITIQTDILDNYIADKLIVKVLKIDVEGHELSVFKGAVNSLTQKRIQNIIFENYSNQEIPDFLTGFGFTIYKINKTFNGVLLSEPGDTRYKVSYEADNFLATLVPVEIQRQFKEKGWTIYSAR
jgi:FkbM family methyltransferase